MGKVDGMGFNGIFNVYTVKKNIKSGKSYIFAIASLAACVCLYIFKDLDFIYELLGKMVDVFVGSVPDLLGFCIGGYAIIVAINGLEKMPAIIEPLPDKGKSYYQILSADFAMTLIVMCTLLLVSYLTGFLVDLELVAINEVIGKVTNLLFIAFFLWTGAMTVVMLMETVANLFSTSMILQAAASIAGKTNDKEKNEETEVSVYKVDSWFGSFTVTRLEKKKK